jgi:hypothetical protein
VSSITAHETPSSTAKTQPRSKKSSATLHLTNDFTAFICALPSSHAPPVPQTANESSTNSEMEITTRDQDEILDVILSVRILDEGSTCPLDSALISYLQIAYLKYPSFLSRRALDDTNLGKSGADFLCATNTTRS